LSGFVKKHGALISLLIFSIFIYIAGITPSFSSDDYIHLINNQAASLQEALKVFVEPFGREYRPMVRISLWLNHLMGDTALAFKITNLFLHLGCVLLLYILLMQIGISKLTNIIATSIFAVHPIHTTSIHFILGRTDLVAALFYLATLASIANWNLRPTRTGYFFSVVWFVAALASKEMSVTLPLLMGAILLMQAGTLDALVIRRVLRQVLPFIIITSVYVLTRIVQWLQMPDSVAVYTNYSVPHLINNYLQWFFALGYPFDLYVAQEWLISKPLIFIFCCLGAGILILIGGWLAWRNNLEGLYKTPLLWLGIVWLLVTLIPMSGGNPHRWYLYLPSAGFGIAIAAAWESLNRHRKLATGFLLILLAIYSVETFRQSYIWHVQHQRNEFFLREFAKQNLHKEKELYFANIPFGYKSAFMFTHSALGEAVKYRYGEAPTIYPLSYLNITDSTNLAVAENKNTITFSLKPDAFEFFLWNASKRRFTGPEFSVVYNLERKLEQVESNKKISRYSILVPEHHAVPIYYFDGKKIRRFDPSY
jgi:protein O-mannosyl-transferase